MRFHDAGEAKFAVYDCLVPNDDESMEKQSKSLDMLQLLLDYIAVLRTSMQSIVKYRVAWSVIQSVGLSPSEPCKNG